MSRYWGDAWAALTWCPGLTFFGGCIISAALSVPVNKRRKPKPEIGDDIHPDGTPYSDDEIDQMIREWGKDGRS